MFHPTRIILVLYIAFVSTSTITSTENSNTLSATQNTTSTTENFVKPISAAGKNSSIQSNDTSHQLRPDQHMPIITEGGSIKPVSTSISALAKGEPKRPLKIVPRKGATSPNITISSTPSLNLSTNATIKLSNTTALPIETNVVLLKNNITNSTTTNSTSKVDSQKDQKSSGKIVSSTTVKPRKHKPKPTVTIGDSEDDKPIRSSNPSPTGSQRKIDYIVPVVISMITLPMLSLIMYVLYRRGRDCWDKRHYRRMDFLIDGMYNE